MPRDDAHLLDILKAQIEEHRTDVFYNMDTTGWGSDLLRNLPGCVKRVIAWHASPFRGVDFTDYHLVVCNFPSIRQKVAIPALLTVPDGAFPTAQDVQMQTFGPPRSAIGSGPPAC